MAPPGFSVASAVLRPPTTAAPAVPPPKRQHKHGAQHSPPMPETSRRSAALLSFLAVLPSIHPPSPATAFAVGISGPKDWLKERKKNASKFLLAPVDASREILRTAYVSLIAAAKDPGDADKDSGEVLTLVRSAARDCVPRERNPFVVFQARTGVEVCTFRLIVKNASSLLGDDDSRKLGAEAALNDLVASFGSLIAEASEAELQASTTRQKVEDAIAATLSILDKFEQGIKDCLEG